MKGVDTIKSYYNTINSTDVLEKAADYKFNGFKSHFAARASFGKVVVYAALESTLKNHIDAVHNLASNFWKFIKGAEGASRKNSLKNATWGTIKGWVLSTAISVQNVVFGVLGLICPAMACQSSKALDGLKERLTKKIEELKASKGSSAPVEEAPAPVEEAPAPAGEDAA